VSDLNYEIYQRYGTNAERLAFTPNPPTSGGKKPLYKWYETDTGNEYTYHTAWALVGSTASAAGSLPLLSADPVSPADGTWWAVTEGTSPTQTISIKVRDGGVTVTVASITK
jgi:hypothetical protein